MGTTARGGGCTMLMRVMCILGFGLSVAGCATLEHSLKLSEYAGRSLSTRSAEGAQHFDAELAVDVTLRDFVAANGRPDYLHVVDRMNLYFFYVGEDRAAKFERDLFASSVPRDLGRIPGSLFKLLPKREVDAILARRDASKQRASARVARRRAVAPAPPPAAPAPSGYGDRGFDVRSVMERMRPPLTAADPGVSGWREVEFSDGVSGSTATLGGNRYEVRRDRLVVAMAMPKGKLILPADARLEVLRLNGAIFGAHAKVVTEQVMGFMQQVAADRSGRTPMAQRIRGRLVRVDRVPSTGLLVYSVRP